MKTVILTIRIDRTERSGVYSRQAWLRIQPADWNGSTCHSLRPDYQCPPITRPHFRWSELPDRLARFGKLARRLSQAPINK